MKFSRIYDISFFKSTTLNCLKCKFFGKKVLYSWSGNTFYGHIYDGILKNCQN